MCLPHAKHTQHNTQHTTAIRHNIRNTREFDALLCEEEGAGGCRRDSRDKQSQMGRAAVEEGVGGVTPGGESKHRGPSSSRSPTAAGPRQGAG